MCDALELRSDARQSRMPKKHKASPPELDDGYNSADEYGGHKSEHNQTMSAVCFSGSRFKQT